MVKKLLNIHDSLNKLAQVLQILIILLLTTIIQLILSNHDHKNLYFMPNFIQ